MKTYQEPTFGKGAVAKALSDLLTLGALETGGSSYAWPSKIVKIVKRFEAHVNDKLQKWKQHPSVEWKSEIHQSLQSKYEVERTRILDIIELHQKPDYDILIRSGSYAINLMNSKLQKALQLIQ